MPGSTRPILAAPTRLAVLRRRLPAKLAQLARACPGSWSTNGGTPGLKMLLRDLRTVGAVADDGEEPVWRLTPAEALPAPVARPLPVYPLPVVPAAVFACVPLRARLTGAACLRRQDVRGKCGPGNTYPLHDVCGPRKAGEESPCAQGRAVRARLGVAPVDVLKLRAKAPVFAGGGT